MKSSYQISSDAHSHYYKIVKDTGFFDVLRSQLFLIVSHGGFRWALPICLLTFVQPLIEAARLIYVLTLLHALLGDLSASGMVQGIALFNWELPLPFVEAPYSPADIYSIVICIAFMTLLQSGLYWMNIRTSALAQHHMLENIRAAIVDKMFGFDMKFHSESRSGELAYLMNAEINRTSGLISMLVEFVSLALNLLLISAILLSISIELTLGLFVVMGLLLLIQPRFIRAQRSVSLALENLSLKASGIFQEILYGIRLVKMAGLERREKEKYLTLHQERLPYLLKQENLSAGAKAMGDWGLIFALAGAFVISTTLNVDLLSMPATMLGYVFLLMRAFPVFTGINKARLRLASIYGPIFRVVSFLKDERYGSHFVSRTDPGDTGISVEDVDRGELVAENIHFSYDDDSQVLNNISISFRRNEISALVGLSGSGKSTLMDVLAGFQFPNEGEVRLGKSNLKLAPSDYRRYVGYLSQEPIIFHDTIADNIRFFRPSAEDWEVEEAARLALALEFISDSPQEFDTMIGERGMTLSGGQRQRIALARVFLYKPEILFLDEATSALDVYTEAEIYDSLMRMKSGKIIVVAAHRLSAVTAFDNIAVIHDGRLVEQGPHSMLMERGQLYASLYRLQEFIGDDSFDGLARVAANISRI